MARTGEVCEERGRRVVRLWRALQESAGDRELGIRTRLPDNREHTGKGTLTVEVDACINVYLVKFVMWRSHSDYYLM